MQKLNLEEINNTNETKNKYFRLDNIFKPLENELTQSSGQPSGSAYVLSQPSEILNPCVNDCAFLETNQIIIN
jgi:hypothetical protein